MIKKNIIDKCRNIAILGGISDLLITFYALVILKIPLSYESNLLVRFIIENQYWHYLFAYGVMYISCYYTYFSFLKWQYSRNKLKSTVVIGFIFSVLSFYPLVTWVVGLVGLHFGVIA